MARYSREQRDRAVDLYIKYERCAADVIHELGYPGKGALLSWYADRLEEERTGVPSRRGERYSDEQKQAAVDHYLEYGRRPGRTMLMLGYPKSKELLMAWIDELAPGQRKPGRGPVPEELKRETVVVVASERLKSREAAAELGVEASVVGKPGTSDARRIQGDARDGDTQEEEPSTAGERKAGVATMASGNIPTSASGPRDTADPADALASMEARLARLQARLGELDGDVERQRREKKELDIEIAIRKGALELLGKEPGTDPENLTSQEKTILVKTVSETMHVTARSLLSAVGIARSTYHYQVNAMKRPDKDTSLLELVREAFENSKRRYGYKRIHLELKSMGVIFELYLPCFLQVY